MIPKEFFKKRNKEAYLVKWGDGSQSLHSIHDSPKFSSFKSGVSPYWQRVNVDHLPEWLKEEIKAYEYKLESN